MLQQLGPYQLGKRIGKGGMGSVYEAVDEQTGQRVAVKALSPQLATAEGFRERFEAEIESLKILQHEGIVRLLGYGEHEGLLFYSMELVDGPSLEEELNAARRFDWRETLNIGIQVCRALKHAHDHGVVHRDIKPANLLLAEGDRVKIADFGIARLFGSSQLTTAGGVLGTADYMSPEQADGRSVTDKCDQYSLGSVMYALLAGRPPFRATTMPEMLQLQRFAEAEPVRRYAPDTPEQLDRLIQQLLSKDPEVRFPNALVLARHMEAMNKALSRPLKRQTEDGVTPEASSAGSNDATAAMNPEATLAHGEQGSSGNAHASSDSIDILVPDEVYDAPTMAVEDQLELEVAESAAPEAARPTPSPAPTTRFTTVDEEAERELQQRTGVSWAIAGQLAGLVAALAAVIGIGWALMRPPTADELFAEINAGVEAGDDLRNVAASLAEFEERFVDDPRNEELEHYRDELELQRFQRKLQVKSRLSHGGIADPAELVYADAMAAADEDPGKAAEMLQDLLALYGDQQQDAPWLTLAQRQLSKLRESDERMKETLLPAIEARLAVAKRWEKSDADRARRMYEAVIDLYGHRAWAAEAVETARRRLPVGDSE